MGKTITVSIRSGRLDAVVAAVDSTGLDQLSELNTVFGGIAHLTRGAGHSSRQARAC